MGISVGVSRGDYTTPAQVPPHNPNPWNFSVLRTRQYGDFHVSEVQYPDATNYEGRKIIVTHGAVAGLAKLDPHFSEDGFVVARFGPNEWGWDAACAFAEMTMGDET